MRSSEGVVLPTFKTYPSPGSGQVLFVVVGILWLPVQVGGFAHTNSATVHTNCILHLEVGKMFFSSFKYILFPFPLPFSPR